MQQTILPQKTIKARAYIFIFLVITFALSGGLGLVITTGLELTQQNWRMWLLARVLPVLLSGIGLTIYFFIFAAKWPAVRAGFCLIFLMATWVICQNSILDLIFSSQSLTGELNKLDFYNLHMEGDKRRPSYTYLKPKLIFTSQEGNVIEFKPNAHDWSKWKDIIKTCGQDGEMSMIYLSHLERLLDYQCHKTGVPLP